MDSNATLGHTKYKLQLWNCKRVIYADVMVADSDGCSGWTTEGTFLVQHSPNKPLQRNTRPWATNIQQCDRSWAL